MAIRPAGKPMEFNPGGEATFEAGTSVVVMGQAADIDRFRVDYRL